MYTYLDIVSFGGPSGDYAITAPMDSCKWMEYRLVSIANSSLGDTQVLLSTKQPPKQLTYDNTTTLTTDGYIHSRPIYVPKASTINGQGDTWERITHSQHKLFARIDAASSGACYVTIQFRARVLDVIPGPFPAVSLPELGHQMNIERSERIEKRLKQLGMPPERLIDNGR
jgi:hypothetical protein